MQRPRVWREVLMLFASFIRSPLFWSLQRSDPARSHRESLKKTQMVSPELLGLFCSHQIYNSDTLQSPTQLPQKGREGSFRENLGYSWTEGPTPSMRVKQDNTNTGLAVTHSKILCPSPQQPLSQALIQFISI